MGERARAIPIKRIIALVVFMVAVIAIQAARTDADRLELIQFAPLVVLVIAGVPTLTCFIIWRMALRNQSSTGRSNARAHADAILSFQLFLSALAALSLFFMNKLVYDTVGLAYLLIAVFAVVFDWIPTLMLHYWLNRDKIIPTRTDDNHCIACDYDLQGIESDRCPECGIDLVERPPEIDPFTAFFMLPPLGQRLRFYAGFILVLLAILILQVVTAY
jgi:hypothetical protein